MKMTKPKLQKLKKRVESRNWLSRLNTRLNSISWACSDRAERKPLVWLVMYPSMEGVNE